MRLCILITAILTMMVVSGIAAEQPRALANTSAPPVSVTLERGGVRVALDPVTAQPAAITDTRTGLAFTNVNVDFAVRLPRAGVEEWLGMAAFERTAFESKPESFTAVYASRETNLPGLVVRTTLALNEQGELNFSFAISNQSSAPVLAIRYPVLHNLSLEGHGQEAVFAPIQTGLFFSEPRTTPITWIDHYPRYCMGWADYFTPTGGLMLLVHTPDLVMHELAVRTKKPRMEMWMGLKDSVLPGGTKSYSNSVILHAGDWKAAAARYGAYFRATFPQTYAFPEWVRRANGYMSFGYQGTEPPGYDAECPHMLYDAWHLGMEHIQIWGQTGHHVCPAYYWPSPQRGGEQAFIRMIKHLRDSGMYVGAYFLATSVSAYHAQADTWPGVENKESIPKTLRPPDWEWLLRYRQVPDWTSPVPRRFTATELDAIRQTVRYDSQQFDCSFHAAAFREDYFRFWIDRYIETYGIDVPYLDVYSMRPKFQEFNPFLGLYGDGTEGALRRRFLGDLLERHRERTADRMLILTEGTLDAYNDRAGGLISNFSRPLIEKSFWPTVAYRTVFPDAVLYEGHNNGWWNFPQSVICIAHAILNGNRFDLMYPFAFNNEARAMIWMRAALTEYLQDIEFAAVDSALADLPEGTEARLFRKPNSTLMTIYNPDRKPGLKLALRGALTGETARIFLLAPDAAPVAVSNAGTSIALPDARACALLLVPRGAERVAPVVGCLPEQLPDGGTRLRLFGLNPGAVPQTVSWKVHRLETEKTESLAADPSLAAGEIRTRAVEYPPRERHARERVIITAAWEGGSREIRRTIEPLHLDFGTREVSFISHYPLHLAPNTRYRLSCETWRSPQGVAHLAVHDPFKRENLCFLNVKTPPETWGAEHVDFKTGEQGWLYIYLYNRSKDRAKEIVRFRNIEISAIPGVD